MKFKAVMDVVAPVALGVNSRPYIGSFVPVAAIGFAVKFAVGWTGLVAVFKLVAVTVTGSGAAKV